MNMRHVSIGIISALLSAALATSARADRGAPPEPVSPASSLAQNGSAFTYQGQLRKNGAPVNASCNASFSLFDAATGGAQVGGTVTSPTLQVSNGLFSLPLDFGWNFNGEARWLETAIGCGETPAALAPRTSLLPAPYAFALPGMRTVPGTPDGLGNPTMNVIGGVKNAAVDNTISANSYNSNIGGGAYNRIDNASPWGSVGGGSGNHIDSNSTLGVIGGGSGNIISKSQFSTIGGGSGNRVDTGGNLNAIGGGYFNVISGTFNSTISGGYLNIISATYNSAIGGGYNNQVLNNSFNSTISGGNLNTIQTESYYSAIAGGSANGIRGTYYGSIGGGFTNHIYGGSTSGTIGGGSYNVIDAGSSNDVISGGYGNVISGTSLYGGIGGGSANNIAGGTWYGAIGGGDTNRIDYGSDSSAIGGGSTNVITSALYAAIPGGLSNRVEGDFGLAAGRQAKALHNGTFVWGDSTNADIASTAPNQFIVRASGGVTLFTNAGATVGASLFAGSGSWTTLSDRNLKANTVTVNPRAVLAAVASLPVSTWNYTSQDASIRHIGPMAQDFYAAFNVGESDTGISTVDAQGVALAAIQGLYQQNQELMAQIEALQNQASPPAAFRPFDLLSVIAVAGFAIMWLQQRRAKRGQA